MLEEFEYNGKAMGTEYFISIVCNSKGLADNIYNIAKNDIEQYEALFSRFIPTSELSILNEKKEMIVSPLFLNVTMKAYRLFIRTRGIFNPLVQVSRLGYDRNFLDIKDDINIDDESIYDIDFSSVSINQDKSLVRLNEGQKLDYGGFLKGYLAEIIVKNIKSSFPDIAGIIVNIGGDIYTQGLDKNGNKFIFNIYNPISKDDVFVTLYDQGLATSGIYKRSWFHLNEKIHHILDITGKRNPESDIISISVIHNDGAKAEAYTKVFLSMDYKNALELLGEKDISFVIIKKDGKVFKNII